MANKFLTGYTNFLYVVLLVVIGASVSPGCATGAYFRTANDVNKMKGIVYMDNGTVKKGLLTVNFETYFSNPDRSHPYEINFVAEGDTVSEKLNITNIKSYSIDGNSYVPKIISLNSSEEKHFLFVKRMTDENAKMQLYELYQTYRSNETGQETTYYFISMPSSSKYEVMDINSIKLVPAFEYKMSTYITDCPTLHDKILGKQKGYNYNFTSLISQRLSVIQKIVKEYNDCK